MFIELPFGPMCAHTDYPITASEKCHQEKRKTVNGEDILFAMTSLGFENYAEALKIYLAKYREVGILSILFPIDEVTSIKASTASILAAISQERD